MATRGDWRHDAIGFYVALVFVHAAAAAEAAIYLSSWSANSCCKRERSKVSRPSAFLLYGSFYALHRGHTSVPTTFRILCRDVTAEMPRSIVYTRWLRKKRTYLYFDRYSFAAVKIRAKRFYSFIHAFIHSFVRFFNDFQEKKTVHFDENRYTMYKCATHIEQTLCTRTTSWGKSCFHWPAYKKDHQQWHTITRTLTSIVDDETHD